MPERYLRGGIYIVDFNPVRGSEQGGMRPAIILQNDIGNRYSPTVIVAPITSREKPVLPVHLPIYGVPALEPRSLVLLEQVRTIDKSRIGKYLGLVDDELMRTIDSVVSVSLGIHSKSHRVMVMTLCSSCKSQFENADFIIRRISRLNGPKDTCDFCNIHRGFDYEVERSEGSAALKGRSQ